ncbi:ATP-dependent sacrificial sulfur transferase LarE [Desulfosarcina sp. OttesenSCG-928-A07]|nr:ATP-dependent sacrificial sulfur transferase LarE [Desulfosarcina sp. OttesenSCG-928-G17]MDL2330330.1 ATP-dependent sacrificial sulfur transferase LarE [Desulfosarcina sp. OttesenSCG-928-A07]
MILKEKKTKLHQILRTFDRLAVALSGGVDSMVLLAEAHRVMGKRVMAITARSVLFPPSEITDAEKIARELCVDHVMVDVDVLAWPDFIANPPDRCYICKKRIFGTFLTQLAKMGIHHLAHGANLDDQKDIRPGMKAAEALGVAAPLLEAEMTKADIRALAQDRGLFSWNKPAMACLATRIPFGTPVSAKILIQIRDAEKILSDAGFEGCRVRHHGAIARIEVAAADLGRLVSPEMGTYISAKLKAMGFSHVCADLSGYVTGNMNQLP